MCYYIIIQTTPAFSHRGIPRISLKGNFQLGIYKTKIKKNTWHLAPPV